MAGLSTGMRLGFGLGLRSAGRLWGGVVSLYRLTLGDQPLTLDDQQITLE